MIHCIFLTVPTYQLHQRSGICGRTPWGWLRCLTCGERSWAGPERGSEILCVLTHGMGSTPPPPQVRVDGSGDSLPVIVVCLLNLKCTCPLISDVTQLTAKYPRWLLDDLSEQWFNNHVTFMLWLPNLPGCTATLDVFTASTVLEISVWDHS